MLPTVQPADDSDENHKRGVPIDEYNQDKYKFVKQHEQEIQRIRKRRGAHHPSVAVPLNSLGLHYQYVTKDGDNSIQCHREALTILRQAVSEQVEGAEPSSESTPSGEDGGETNEKLPLSIAATLSDLGCALTLKGDHESAMNQFMEAMDIYRSINMTISHPRAAATLRCIRRIHPHYDETTIGLPIELPPSAEESITRNCQALQLSDVVDSTDSPHTVVPRSC